MSLMASWRVLRFYLNHPLGSRNRIATMVRIFRWQLGSRILGMPVAVPFVDGARLLVGTGMHGTTGNIYAGLVEFEDMAFVLHMTREQDRFIDVGANGGVYSILAASRGADVLAVEPVPESYEQLLDNVHLNRFSQKIDTRNIGVGKATGELRFSAGTGPTNHVLAPGETAKKEVTMVVESLDAIVSEATFVKIDVEGFESEVVSGARKLLSSDSLQAVLVELNGMGARYGFDDADIHDRLIQCGFVPVRYNPFRRQLIRVDGYRRLGNTLYVRWSEGLEVRLRNAAPFIWEGNSI